MQNSTIKKNRKILFLYCLIINFVLISCTSIEKIPVGELYEKPAVSNYERNPVILIHGIAGAQLVQKGTNSIVWGAFNNEGIDPNTPEGAMAFALPMWEIGDNFHYDDIPSMEDDVYASAPLEKVDLSLAGLSLSIDVYKSVLSTLGVGGYVDPITSPGKIFYGKNHYTCFTFFYDWRKDNVTNAILFGKFLENMAEQVKNKDIELGRKRKEVKFDVVAHSMGGLIARYYLQYGGVDVCLSDTEPKITWAGSKYISRLVQIGSPNTGSATSIKTLSLGEQYSIVLPKFQPCLLASFPSVYQLLPRNRHKIFIDENEKTVDIDIYDINVWEKNKWGIFSDEQQNFLQENIPNSNMKKVKQYVQCALQRAKKFHHALDTKPQSPNPSQIYIFASQSIPTLNKIKLLSTNQLSFEGENLYSPGDETVTLGNALADERQGKEWQPWLQSNIPFDGIYLLEGDHLGMTSEPSFTNNILHLLLEVPPRNVATELNNENSILKSE